jgi:single-strand DNA-binding protein
MSSINRVFILGNLGADPELRYTPSQMPVCTLRVATNERRKGPDGQPIEQTEWHSIVVWGKSAENCNQYLAKGRTVLVEGRLQTRKWQDQDGKDRYKTEIVASNVQFIGRGESGGERDYAPRPAQSTQSGGSAHSQEPAFNDAAPVSFDDDDIPF